MKEKVIQELKKPKTSIEEQIKIDNDPEYRKSSEVSFSSNVAREPVNRADPRDQVVNNYYYYGMGPPQPPQQHHYNEPVEKKSKKSRRKKRPPTPSTSESSEEEYVPLPPDPQVYQEPLPKPRLKFNYA